MPEEIRRSQPRPPKYPLKASEGNINRFMYEEFVTKGKAEADNKKFLEKVGEHRQALEEFQSHIKYYNSRNGFECSHTLMSEFYSHVEGVPVKCLWKGCTRANEEFKIMEMDLHFMDKHYRPILGDKSKAFECWACDKFKGDNLKHSKIKEHLRSHFYFQPFCCLNRKFGCWFIGATPALIEQHLDRKTCVRFPAK